MSTSHTVTLWCDLDKGEPGAKCLNWTVGSGNARTAAEVRRESKAEGWGRRGGLDLCPHHLRVAPDGARKRRDQ